MSPILLEHATSIYVVWHLFFTNTASVTIASAFVFAKIDYSVEQSTNHSAYCAIRIPEQLREVRGLVNFYRRFIPHCAHILLPLTKIINGKQNQRYHLTMSCLVNSKTSSRSSLRQQCSYIQLLMQVWNSTRMHLNT